jgi:tetratricopeptide (TPR) repeat protein
MSSFQTEERNKLRRQWNEQAIAMAMQNRWPDAVRLNQNILDIFPDDTDALNRLGRALMELGRYRESREAYQKTLRLDASNTIAKKNLQRLATLKTEEAPPSAEKVDPRMFIAETGKTGVVNLLNPAPRDLLARMAAGDVVNLRPEGRRLRVFSLKGEPLGDVDPKVGQRLIDLMATGNKYTAAVISNDEGNLRVFIREAYQDPRNVGKVSFPVRAEAPGIRPYTRDTLLKYEYEEEEEIEAEEAEFGEEHEEAIEEPLDIGELEEDHTI